MPDQLPSQREEYGKQIGVFRQAIRRQVRDAQQNVLAEFTLAQPLLGRPDVAVAINDPSLILNVDGNGISIPKIG